MYGPVCTVVWEGRSREASPYPDWSQAMEQRFVTGMVGCCPYCGHDRVAVRVVTWADFKDGRPYRFDPEDIDYAEPIAGEAAICRSCESSFTIT